ncbi:cell wall protein PRY3 [Monomorium pharaonis]|uniref:cell wall protein PRY3 n=1 Tax=Monomorium pharaonis TaxID=307658 RepID=UPI001747BD25|nr:cell wall protein PRY3 [Monomorium pharaonis]
MEKPLHLIVILQLSSAFAYRYDPWYRADTQRPVDVITDVVNELGVRILQQYTTHGNVAFSPTGVAFVLAALYEGSAGRGSQQIAEAIGLPANRDVTRIGFRDIHRRLRSYLNADGFLGGLTLSRENTRLRPEYEDILKFYGFDLSSIEQEANVTVSMGDSSGATKLPTSTVSTITLPEMVTVGNVSDMTTTTTTMTTTTLTGVMTTFPPAGAEVTVIPSDATQQTVTMAPTMSATDVQATPVTSVGTVVQNTTQSVNSLTTVTSGESVQTLSTGAEIVANSPNATITPMINANGQTIPTTTVVGISSGLPNENVQTSVGTGMTTAPANDAGVTVPMSTDIQVSSALSSANSEVPATTNSSVSSGEMMSVNTSTLSATLSTVSTNSLTTVVPAISNSANVTIPSPVTETTTANGATSASSTETSIDTSAGMTTANDDLAMTTMTNINDAVNSATTLVPPVGNSFTNFTTSLVDGNTIAMNRKKKDLTDVINSNTVKDESTDGSPNLRKRKARSPRGYFSSYPDEGIWMQNLEIWKSYNTVNPSDSSIGDSSAEMSFLVNGCDISSVSASRYIAVLPFAYFPSLQAVALEFPLDDPRYNIILFMPTDKTDTHRLARDLSGKSLRLLRKQLQPTWVRATIPSFMLRGFVTLTSFLQRLGILDVFEPRVADLSPMTSDLGVYARDVQQSIGVNIRNYMKPDRTHSRESSNVVPPRRDYYRYLPPGNGLFERAGPEPFTALHPFLYFIVDTETSVSLITGRVDDPLNSRIL